jgi:hypothetical protein
MLTTAPRDLVHLPLLLMLMLMLLLLGCAPQAKKLVDNSGAPTIEGLKMQVSRPHCQSWFCCALMAPARC